MPRARRSVAVVIFSAALGAAAAGCGSSGSSASPAGQGTAAAPGTKATPGVTKPAATASPATSADPLAALTPEQMVSRALADTEAAPQVHITGSIPDSGKTINLDFTLRHGQGCEGTFSEANAGSIRLIYLGKTIWMQPDEAFYKSQGGQDAATLALLKGKYLKVKADGSGVAAMAGLCTLSTLLGGFGPSSGALLIPHKTTIDGQRAVKLSDTGDSASLVVSDAAKPELLRLNDPSSSDGDLRLSYDSPALTITPPPASIVLNGADYGF